MASRTWITNSSQYVYQRPYEDAWGTLHDPRTEWDELLKNYKPWVMLLQVGEGTRRMAWPASVGAEKIIRKQRQRQQDSAMAVRELEADYLQKTHSTKHWRRRQKKKLTMRSKAASCVEGATGA